MRASRISGTMNGAHVAAEDFTAAIGLENFMVTGAVLNKNRLTLKFGGKPYDVVVGWQPGDAVLYLRDDKGGETALEIARMPGGGYRLTQGGTSALVTVRSPRNAKLAVLMPVKPPPDTSRLLLCPMPGLVVSINVSEGQEIKAGEPLAVVEAMKMENVLIAERDGKIKKINVKKGDSLAVDEVILELA
jgi:propionyl-CoA carboxylase alpha chain